MTQGLLYVLSEPGRVPDEEFHDWYDHEHAPARLAVPGIRNGFRYRAADGLTPTWMACYDLGLDALASPEYARLRTRSPRERRVVEGLAVLDRRVYELIDSHGSMPADGAGGTDCAAPAEGPAPTEPAGPGESAAPAVALCVAMSTGDEAAFHDWYLGEHIPLLHTLPGWWRTRRFRRVEGAGPDLLAFHDISSTGLFETGAYRRAVSTPLRDRVMRTVTDRERRVFRFHAAVTPGPGSPEHNGQE
ncbi:hypothetical protein G4Z16_15885 [Streptomyces bathyalis]|uniref:Uncharacterized protein n=1 Tax=Streptomyces bathyalis TaxID=2710756 RepID=A0A7T1WR56_9ACTN|nr:hypothetical protein [Streptomyces bathyalis]QPP07628.1 hypothetical protein G4Z16_15885 [Streptomyces bathyalis]